MKCELMELFGKLDSTTYNHSIRVMGIAKEIEDYYGFEDRNLSTAALVHDIGKVYVSTKILDKKEALSNLERELVDLHPYIGYDMLKGFGINEDICRLVYYHHGLHPISLKEVEDYYDDDIMDRAILLHSIDSYEALTSDRPYHRGYLSDKALEVMRYEKGHHKMFLEYARIMLDNKKKEESLLFRNKENVNKDNIRSVIMALAV